MYPLLFASWPGYKRKEGGALEKLLEVVLLQLQREEVPQGRRIMLHSAQQHVHRPLPHLAAAVSQHRQHHLNRIIAPSAPHDHTHQHHISQHHLSHKVALSTPPESQSPNVLKSPDILGVVTCLLVRLPVLLISVQSHLGR